MSICYHCFRDKGEYEVCKYCGHFDDDRPVEVYHLVPGTVLSSRYIVGKSIGTGGFGIIYRAFDMTLKSIVAIKEFYPAGLVNRAPGDCRVGIFSGDRREEYDRELRRFQEEARDMAAFSSEPDIVNVYNFFEENSTAYTVMEYIQGKLLKDYLRENGPLDVERARKISISILEALGKIHNKKVIHRDISPDNIFLMKDDQVKIFDFGAAKFEDWESGQTRAAVIKAGYVPPEQYRSGAKPTPNMDLYAMGAVLYEMVTGVRPPEGSDRAQQDELAVPSMHSDKVDRALDSIILKSMAVRPELRFQTADEFIRALRENRTFLPVEEELRLRLRRRKLMMGTMGAAIVSLVIVIIMFSTVFSSRNRLSGRDIQKDHLTVWLDTADETLKGELGKAFRKDYPQIDLEIVCKDGEEYTDMLKKAVDQNKLPDVFCCDSLEEKQRDSLLEPLDLMLNSISKSDYRYFDVYRKLYPKHESIPIGYQVKVVYENADKRSDENTDHLDSGKLPEKSTAEIGWMEDMTGEMYEEFGSEDGRLRAIVGDLHILEQVKNVTINHLPPANLTVLPVTEGDELAAEFTDCYGVSKAASENRKNAAMLFLTYMLSDGMQSMMYMQGYDAVPVNQEAYEDYKAAKMTSYLGFLTEYEEKMNFTK